MVKGNKIKLVSCALGNEDVPIITSYLNKHTQIDSLDLSTIWNLNHNIIKGDGIEKLIKITHLKYLSVRNRIDSQGALQIASEILYLIH